MTLPNNPPQTLDYQAFYYPPGASIKFPLQTQIAPFTPNGIYINNRTALSLQFGPSVQGPFTPAGSYTLNVYPWTYGASLYITSLGGTLQATDFLDVHFLSVSSPGGVGVPQITASAPAGWGPVGPGSTLQDINAGDPFNYGQVQQFKLYLTGNGVTGDMHIIGQIISGPAADAGFQFFDRDGVGSDSFTWYAINGLARLFSSVLGADTITIGETGNLTTLTDLLVDGTFRPAGRISAPAVGASGKTLLNWIPLNTPTGATATHNGAVALTSLDISADVPASAVAVAFDVIFSSTSPSQLLGIFNANPVTNVQAQTTSPPGCCSGVFGLPTAQTLYYIVTGAGAWSLALYPTAYAEPS